MPMNWNTEADAKLLCAILQLPGVTVSTPDKEIIAKTMGCTAKAITHRLAHFRSLAKGPATTANSSNDGDGQAKSHGKKKQALKRKQADVESTEQDSKKVKAEPESDGSAADALD